MPDPLDPVTSPHKALGTRASQPDLVSVVMTDKGARIVQHWPRSIAVVLAIFAVFFGFSSLLVFLREYAFSLPSVLVVVIEMMIMYTALAYSINNTYIELTPEVLSVRFGPIPWPGKKSLKRSAVRQLYCKEKESYDRNRWVKYVYELHATTQDGRDVKLLGGQESPEVVRYFEQVLEPWLRIEDQPVDSNHWRKQ